MVRVLVSLVLMGTIPSPMVSNQGLALTLECTSWKTKIQCQKDMGCKPVFKYCGEYQWLNTF